VNLACMDLRIKKVNKQRRIQALGGDEYGIR